MMDWDRTTQTSEDPWGAGCPRPDFAVSMWPPFPDSVLGVFCGRRIDTKDGDKLEAHFAHAGSELKRTAHRKVPSDMHIFQPYWGKPAVRNDRGGLWKRRHHSKPGPRHDPTRLRGRSAMVVP